MDEFFEVLTWGQLGLHEKPIYIVNINGYWDKLIALMDQIVGEGFADASLLDYFKVVADVPELIADLRLRLS